MLQARSAASVTTSEDIEESQPITPEQVKTAISGALNQIVDILVKAIRGPTASPAKIAAKAAATAVKTRSRSRFFVDGDRLVYEVNGDNYEKPMQYKLTRSLFTSLVKAMVSTGQQLKRFHLRTNVAKELKRTAGHVPTGTWFYKVAGMLKERKMIVRKGTGYEYRNQGGMTSEKLAVKLWESIPKSGK